MWRRSLYVAATISPARQSSARSNAHQRTTGGQDMFYALKADRRNLLSQILFDNIDHQIEITQLVPRLLSRRAPH
ncbi:hypothetical protein [uncultured Bartonella sp.]|uniref:hypothetical protein n=1 Tax=uncultured Bartonella sp. TaxID=104108 RepID=UPI00263026E9|nr:hypothetical protein [uncultured Bartonella sp.]